MTFFHVSRGTLQAMVGCNCVIRLTISQTKSRTKKLKKQLYFCLKQRNPRPRNYMYPPMAQEEKLNGLFHGEVFFLLRVASERMKKYLKSRSKEMILRSWRDTCSSSICSPKFSFSPEILLGTWIGFVCSCPFSSEIATIAVYPS